MLSSQSTYKQELNLNDNAISLKEYVLLQDEVAPGFFIKKEDSLFLKKQIIQVKQKEKEFINKSYFSTHLLKQGNFEKTERNKMIPEWIHGVIIICFVLYAIAQYGYYKRMQQIFKAYFANRLFNQLSRDGGLVKERGSIMLFISFILGFSLLIYLSYDFYIGMQTSFINSLLLYGKVVAFVLLYYLLKMGAYNILGFIFKTTKETYDYILNIYIFSQITSVFLLIFILFITYSKSETIILICWGFIGLSFLIRLIRGTLITLSNFKVSIYYIFLYLCTLEILPLFLLAKILSNKSIF